MFKKKKAQSPNSILHLVWSPQASHLLSLSFSLLTVKAGALNCLKGSVPSASFYLCPPHLHWTYHLPSLLELGVEATQLFSHLPRHPEGPSSPGESTPAVGATGRAIILGTQLTRACSWSAGHLPGATTDL